MELNFPKLNAVGIRNGVMVVVTKHFTAAMSRSGINDPTLLRHWTYPYHENTKFTNYSIFFGMRDMSNYVNFAYDSNMSELAPNNPAWKINHGVL